ncbi:ArsR/SmtB family transcription factor [Colwellia ponticola]|uniref:Helix-turn-helix transcriptional regulator n=1 Tax=Colwellia ponticola TaxID=2304625 RepID=A0A8H2JM71_9GAMM|nr:metalloregulator ArsR/SmtB family transcription factor [Colwellia ponticola]TMM45911.1 helix-turn-helix transcriptional regulator [Colwellia ponticola]
MNIKQQKLLENAQEVAAILKQLSNPYRLMILCCLSDNELTVGDLNLRIELSQSALSQHLAKLRDSNIVTTRREAQTIFYRIATPTIEELLRVLHEKFCRDDSDIDHKAVN